MRGGCWPQTKATCGGRADGWRAARPLHPLLRSAKQTGCSCAPHSRKTRAVDKMHQHVVAMLRRPLLLLLPPLLLPLLVLLLSVCLAVVQRQGTKVEGQQAFEAGLRPWCRAVVRLSGAHHGWPTAAVPSPAAAGGGAPQAAARCADRGAVVLRRPRGRTPRAKLSVVRSPPRLSPQLQRCKAGSVPQAWMASR